MVISCDYHVTTLSRFTVRDFEYDPRAIQAEREEKRKLEVQIRKQFVSVVCLVAGPFRGSPLLHLPPPPSSPPPSLLPPSLLHQGPLMNWLRVNFSQAFSAWIHLKALRVFTESVLRYESLHQSEGLADIALQYHTHTGTVSL